MADKPAYLAEDMYSVQKQMSRVQMGAPPLVFSDSKGNVLLTAKKGGLGRHAVLVDQKGNQVGSIQKEGIQLGNTAKYQFLGADNAEIGQVTIKTGMMGMSESVSLMDPKGTLVATAKGNFAGFNYEVMDAQGSKTLVKIYRDTGSQQQGGGLKGMLMQAAGAAMSGMMGKYKVEVVEKSINDTSRLFILELVAVLDEMYQPQNAGVGGMVPGFRV